MNVRLGKLIELKIPLEGYFVMHSIMNGDTELLAHYVESVNKIPSSVFKFLIDNKYLEYSGDLAVAKYTLENIKLTNKFQEEVLGIKNTITFETAFEQLRDHYPKKTPQGRRLHEDLDRCRRLYRDIVVKRNIVDESLHSIILQCTNLLVKEKKKMNKLEFLKALPAYINQKEWQTVQEEVEKLVKDGKFVNGPIKDSGNDENKTVLGGKGF